MSTTPESAQPLQQELSDEDRKLITLARAARARATSSEGAAVRDDTGRTYAAAEVTLPSLRLTALQAAVAAAVSSGAARLEAAAVVTSNESVSAAVYFLVEILDDAITKDVRRTALIAPHVKVQSLSVLASPREGGAEPPRTRTPPCAVWREHADRTLEPDDRVFGGIGLEQRPTRDLLDLTAKDR